MFDFVFSPTPPELVRQRAEAATWIGGRRVVAGAGRATTKSGSTAVVGELEEADDAGPQSAKGKVI